MLKTLNARTWCLDVKPHRGINFHYASCKCYKLLWWFCRWNIQAQNPACSYEPCGVNCWSQFLISNVFSTIASNCHLVHVVQIFLITVQMSTVNAWKVIEWNGWKWDYWHIFYAWIALPMRPENNVGPCVTLSSFSSTCFKGNSFACNRQTSHCRGLPSSVSSRQITLPLTPELTFVPSDSITSNVSVAMPFRWSNSVVPFAILLVSS